MGESVSGDRTVGPVRRNAQPCVSLGTSPRTVSARADGAHDAHRTGHQFRPPLGEVAAIPGNGDFKASMERLPAFAAGRGHSARRRYFAVHLAGKARRLRLLSGPIHLRQRTSAGDRDGAQTGYALADGGSRKQVFSRPNQAAAGRAHGGICRLRPWRRACSIRFNTRRRSVWC